MDCEHIREQLSAWLDGELDAETARSVEAHLAACATCRAERDALHAVHAGLRDAFRGESARAQAIADKVLERRTTGQPPLVAGRGGGPASRLFGYLAAAAAGFLLAVALFVPARQVRPPANVVQDAVSPGPPVVAQVVHATGALEFRSDSTAEWQSVPVEKAPDLRCSANAELRTEPAALCELSTPAGSRLRLNAETAVAFREPDNVELLSGQLWCQAPPTRALHINAANEKSRTAAFTCPSDSVGIATAPANGPLQIMAAAGTIDVAVQDEHHTLETGGVCTVSGDAVAIRKSSEELLTATRWMQPLLALQGHQSLELTSRVDALLAHVGRTKVSYLYEQDLRNLGEFGALPLLRFVQTADPNSERERRHTATRILADTAPIWMAPELIALLSDSDSVVRTNAAHALARLTGQTQGLGDDDWISDTPRRAQAVAAWSNWWQRESVACTPPPAGVQMRAPPKSEPQPMLKARD